MGGYTATQIYDYLRSGRGPDGLILARDAALQQMDTQNQLNQRVGQLVDNMNAAWVGDASSQAQTGAAPLSAASEDASFGLGIHEQALGNQTDAFISAYQNVVPVPTTPPSPSFVHDVSFGTFNTSQDAKVAQYQADSAHNVQVYNQYMDASYDTANQMPNEYGSIPADNATISVYTPGSAGGGGPAYTGVVNPSSAGGYGGTSPSYAGGGGYVSPSSAVAGEAGFGPAGGAVGEVGGWNASEGNGFGMAEEFVGGPGAIGGSGSSGGFGGGQGGQGAAEFGRGGAGGAGGQSTPNRSMISSGANPAAIEEIGFRGGMPMESAPGAQGPMGFGQSGRGEDDQQHRSASYLQEADPDSLFGVDQATAPPVIGE